MSGLGAGGLAASGFGALSLVCQLVMVLHYNKQGSCILVTGEDCKALLISPGTAGDQPLSPGSQ